MAQNLYETLWIPKTATAEEVKKAYRKQAMKYHPDKNKGDATAEKKFKEVNSAYQTLSDTAKRKQYDTFWSASGNPFGWASSGGWNPFWGWAQYSSAWGGFSGFEDLFSQFGGGAKKSSRGQNVDFDFGDLFGNSWGGQSRQQQSSREEAPKPVTLDFEKVYQIPIFDLILGMKIEVTGVYGQKAKLTIPAWTKPGTKFRVKEFGMSEGSKKWNLIVKAEALMPKSISPVDKKMLEAVRDNVGY